MSWMTENPWPLMLILAGSGLILLILGEPKLRIAAVVCWLLSAGVWFLESAIVTPAEQVEDAIQEMLQAFIREDLTTIDAGISDKSDKLRETARGGLALVQLHDSFHVKDVSVTVSPDQQSATVELRANGSLSVRNTSSPAFASTRWRTTWVPEDGRWCLAEVQRLNPVSGEEIGTLSAQ